MSLVRTLAGLVVSPTDASVLPDSTALTVSIGWHEPGPLLNSRSAGRIGRRMWERAVERSVLGRRTWSLPRAAALVLAAAMLTAACGSASVSANASQASPAATGSSESSAPVSSAPATPAASTQPGSSSGTAPVLPANVCDLLDVSTIDSATGLNVSPGQPITSQESDGLGDCLWSETTALSNGLQINAYQQEPFRTELQANIPGQQTVPGVGQLAKGTTTALPNSNIIVASLSVDMGSYGLFLALTSPSATLDQVVKVAKAIK